VHAEESLRIALARLADDHREVIELRYFGGCTYVEIADTLDIPTGTVMSRLHAARRALADIYEELES
jgi:RNA polymerase sigma-70 factor (ECF subfamily)